MRKVMFGIGIVVLLLGGAFVVLGGKQPLTQAAQAQPTAATLPSVSEGGLVVAEAQVVPSQKAALALPNGGIVADVLVKEGDQVRAGQPLVRLEAAEQEAAVAQAEGELIIANASYDKLRAGATPEDVAAAEAQVQQSQGQLQQVRGQTTAADTRAAQARLQEAQAKLAKLLGSKNSPEVHAADLKVQEAQANLATVRDQLSAKKTNAQSQMEQAANALRDRQAEYSRISWDNRNLESQAAAAGQELPQERKDMEAAALRAVQNADETLKQLTVAYQEAQQNEVNGIAAAETQVKNAQVRLDQLRAGAASDEIAAARADVANAQATLDRLQGDERQGSLQTAQAQLTEAEANLNKLHAGASTSDLAIAQAHQKVAVSALQLAQVVLQERELKAPFDGTIAELNVARGEFVSPDHVVGYLADLATLQVETTRLTELDVVRINVGDPVKVSFDALPDVSLPGTVDRIRPLGENKQGDILYTVTIKLAKQDKRLRWNMTATVAVKK